MQSAINFINEGGPVMYVILFVFSFGLSILIERTIYLFKSKIDSQKFMEEIFAYIESGKIGDAKNYCEELDAPLSKIISVGLSNHNYDKEELRETIDEVAIIEIPKLLKRTHYLNLISNVSVLLGLLGTIFGLMQSFISVSGVDPSQKAALLSKGISIAMNTTALGLIVAIPCMLGHSFLSSATQDIIHDIDSGVTKLVNYFSRKNKRSQGASDK